MCMCSTCLACLKSYYEAGATICYSSYLIFKIKSSLFAGSIRAISVLSRKILPRSCSRGISIMYLKSSR
ncbi:hypothetical protein BT96DRAFT_163884 [Gymnopus androsaceus JB14]|uniref:Uncharacterized protein n=1 Tax=Gymnopus androsaceus JB14 TaxID=1447944 RepID=A0A6A4H9M7_9AGAR|nr:hypothetical protein BT96DRAFT_163884 [Gymnopus androsaceus JB14]